MDSTLSDKAWLECEKVIRDFELAWRKGPPRPNVHDYLLGDETLREQLLIELAHVDLELRITAGETVRIEQYLQDYPQLSNPQHLLDLLINEYQLRLRHGPKPSNAEYQARFPAIYEQWHQGIQRTIPEYAPLKGSVGLQITSKPTIAGYIIEEEIGRGGMAVVYRANQPALQRKVAIKTFAIVPTHDELTRFQREVETVARLDHANIVPIYEVGTWQVGTQQVPFFVMKWYPGESLQHVACGPNSNPKLHAETIEKIALAVQHAHDRGILHRDLKPSNILLDDRDEPIVADFGLAGRFDQQQSQLSNTVVGTPAYMAPEQSINPGGVTAAADVYGLGAILYFLLTGRPVFLASSAFATLQLVVNQPPDPPSKWNPAVPSDLATICLKCLEKNPNHRYRSAAELAGDLHRWRTNRPITARPATAVERLVRFVLRHPISSGLTFATFASLAAFIVVLWNSSSRISDKEVLARQALERVQVANKSLTSAFEREQRLLYVERMASASRLWRANQVKQAWAMLEQCPENLRDWEWHYLNSQRQKEPIALVGHQSNVKAIAILPNERLISSDTTGVLKVWDLVTHREVASWKADTGARAVSQFAVDPAGNWFANVDHKNVVVYDTKTYQPIRTLDGRFWIAMSPDGNYLASAVESLLRIWNTKTWEVVAEIPDHEKRIIAGSFSSVGQLAVSCMDRTVRIWDLENKKLVTEPRTRPKLITSLVFLPDHQQLIEGATDSIQIVEAKSGNVIQTFDRNLAPHARFALGTQSDSLAVSGDTGEIRIHDLSGKKMTRTFRGHVGSVQSIAFHSRRPLLLSSANDFSILIWDLNQPQDGRQLTAIEQWVGSPALSLDGKQLALCSSNFLSQKREGVRIVDSETGKTIKLIPGHSEAVYCQDGKIAACCEGGIGVWDINGDTTLHRWPMKASNLRTYLTASSRNSFLAVSESPSKILILKADSGHEHLSITPQLGLIYTMQFCYDGTRLLITGETGGELWDLINKALILKLPQLAKVSELAFAPNNEWFAAAEHDTLVRLREFKSGEVITSLAALPSEVLSMAIHPKGTRIATFSRDGRVRLWDTETGREVSVLYNATPNSRAGKVIWSRDGLRLYIVDLAVVTLEANIN